MQFVAKIDESRQLTPVVPHHAHREHEIAVSLPRVFAEPADVFHNLIKIGKRQYRNPIYLVKEWCRLIDKGKYSSPAALSRCLRVSRARVTQIMNLLQLSPEVTAMISSLGDPLKRPIVVERRLRTLLPLNAEQQKIQVEIMVRKAKYNLQ